MSEKMAEELGKSVLLGKPVIHIQQGNDEVVVIDSSGNRYKTKHVVMAIAPPLLNRIEFSPPLPPTRLQLTQRVPMGSIIKTTMFYKSPFWRDDLNLNGSAMSSEGLCCYCIDDTKPDGSHPAIMGFILADRVREVITWSEQERKEALCKHYAKAFKCDKFLKPIGYIEYNWMADQYSGGCYAANMPPGTLTSYGKHLARPEGRMYFAGTETASHWFGYMEGAIEAGERAASQILYELKHITASEIYREEPESFEFPATPIKRSRAEVMLPSVTACIRFGALCFSSFAAYSMYWFCVGWRGALLFRWLRWRYDIDLNQYF